MLKRHKMDDFPPTSRQLREHHGYEREQPEFALEEVGITAFRQYLQIDLLKISGNIHCIAP